MLLAAHASYKVWSTQNADLLFNALTKISLIRHYFHSCINLHKKTFLVTSRTLRNFSRKVEDTRSNHFEVVNVEKTSFHFCIKISASIHLPLWLFWKTWNCQVKYWHLGQTYWNNLKSYLLKIWFIIWLHYTRFAWPEPTHYESLSRTKISRKGMETMQIALKTVNSKGELRTSNCEAPKFSRTRKGRTAKVSAKCSSE